MMSEYVRFSDLGAEAPIPPRGIHSQTLSDAGGVTLVLFAFAPGEELSEHTSARPAIVHILDGEAELSAGDYRFTGAAGTWFRMPAGMPHSVRARTPLRMALTLLPAGG
ncbi:cupin domain-containing protein [soil metagenome]